MIKVIDNFIQDQDYLEVINNFIVVHDFKLQGSNSNQKGLNNFLYSDIKPSSYIETLILKITKIPSINIKSIGRVYINANFPGKWGSGRWHTDDGKITALFYPCEWDINNGGGTSFEDGTTVDYVQNRLVLFDANMKHKADIHTADAIRFSIAIKMDATWS